MPENIYVHVYELSTDIRMTMHLELLCLTLQLDQMDLEIHDVSTDLRPSVKQRLVNYKRELNRLRKDFVSVKSIYSVHNIVCTPTSRSPQACLPNSV